MDEAWLTPFPDLRATVAQPQTLSTSLEYSWDGGLRLPTEVILLAWADLLHSYTGDPAPIFSLEGEAIKFDIATHNHSNVDVQRPSPSNGRGTGVFLGSVRNPHIA